MAIPLDSLTDTWNNGGTDFDAIDLDVTNTASGAGSRLLALRVGGNLVFGVTPAGLTPGMRRSITFSFDGQGSVIATDTPGPIIRLPVKGTITGVSVTADAAGNAVFDVLVGATAAGVATIVAAAPPTLSGVQSSYDSTLTGWTKTFSAGNFIQVSVDGTPTVMLQATVVIEYTEMM